MPSRRSAELARSDFEMGTPAVLLHPATGAHRDAWDVLQKMWLAAFEGLRSLHEPALLPVWLHRIARNLAMTHYRGQRHTGSLPDELPSAGIDDAPDAEAEAFDDALAVHRALNGLSVAHREVLTLSFLQDLSIEQIAQVLEVSVGTVKSRVHYAKRALRAILKEEVA
jgi:RNA polymerase sigma-70 factor, ECF subfamily